jgi:hypothetical protein
MNRRRFVQLTAGAAAGASAGLAPATGGQLSMRPQAGAGYTYRIGFGCWTNDMRNTALPLQQWPAPQFDDATVEGLVRTLDVIAEAGYTHLDTFGLFATNDYPPDIVSAFEDQERNRQVARVFRAAAKRGIRMCLPLGLFTWGWDRIINEDPSVRGKDAAGNPHAHAMCGAQEKAWRYVEKLIDTMFARHDFGGVHMESADLGYCECPECAGKYGVVGYNARLNMRAGDTIKASHPDVLVYTCPINWVPWTLGPNGEQQKVSEAQLADIIELSRHIDLFMDQGHGGRMVAWEDVPRLHCAYGTSGGLWVYHGPRQERLSYFMPYPQRAVKHIRDHHAHGARGCLYYQGPMVNPAVELTSAVAGRAMCDPGRDAREVTEEVIEHYYRPHSPEACRKLADVFFTAEEAFFGQWNVEQMQEVTGLETPGEFMIGVLFNQSPDPAACLVEPFLYPESRAACKAGLKAALAALATLEGQFDDGGRLERIARALTTWCHLLTTVMLCKGEAWAD